MMAIKIKQATLWSLVLLAFGGGFLFGAYKTLQFSLDRLENDERADGIVTGFEQEYDYDSEAYFYYAEIVFEDLNGYEHTIRDGVGSPHPRFEIGETVPLRYSPTNPGGATIQRFANLYAAPLILCIFGVLILGGGIALLVATHRRG